MSKPNMPRSTKPAAAGRPPETAHDLESQASALESRIGHSSSTEAEDLNLCIAVSELLIKAVQLATSDTERARLRRKCAARLRHAEAIKASLAKGGGGGGREGSGADAGAGASGLYDYTYVGAASKSHGGRARGQGQARTAELPMRGDAASATTATAMAAVNDDSYIALLPTKEQLVLLRSSKLNGFSFPPWKGKPDADEFSLSGAAAGMFLDAPALSLSPEHISRFEGWKRPREIFASDSLYEYGRDARDGPTMVSRNAPDFVQGMTSDCSVVASLCALAAHGGERRMQEVLCTLFYPYDDAAQHPAFSENGKYVVRLYFNGCFRRVVIDDLLPARRASRAMHVLDRANPGLLWPALVEKAYLKVRGAGYNASGSNSATDVCILTGWIPEQLYLRGGPGGESEHSHESALDEIWQRMYGAFRNGDVVVTAGTGRLTPQEEAEYGLASKHDYAVLQLKEVGHRRLLLVKNPWSDDNGAGGASGGSRAIIHAPSNDAGQNEGVIDGDGEAGGSSGSTPQSVALSPTTSTGAFWLAYDELVQHFESLYLNWSPALFHVRRDIHFSWTVAEAAPPRSFRTNPQFAVRNGFDDAATVWLLLTRHFVDRHGELGLEEGRGGRNLGSGRSSACQQQQQQQQDEDEDAQQQPGGLISLYVFKGADNTSSGDIGGGQRVIYSSGAIEQSPYVDTPQTLVQLEMPPATTYTVVPSQERLHGQTERMTLSVFATAAAFSSSSNILATTNNKNNNKSNNSAGLSVQRAKEVYSYWTTQHSAWTRTTAGGNASSPTYASNPQFRLTLRAPADLVVVLETLAARTAVHVALLWSRGERVLRAPAARDVLQDSGEYRRGGCAVARVRAAALGAYTVVCSAFAPGQRGAFSLHVGCCPLGDGGGSSGGEGATPCQLEPIPSEDAGRLSTLAPPAVFPFRTCGDGGGGDGGGHGAIASPATRLVAPLLLSRMTRVRLIARYRLRDAFGDGGRRSSSSSRSSRGPIYFSPLRLSLQTGCRSDVAASVSARVLAVSNGGRFSIDDAARGGLRTPDADIGPDMLRPQPGQRKEDDEEEEQSDSEAGPPAKGAQDTDRRQDKEPHGREEGQKRGEEEGEEEEGQPHFWIVLERQASAAVALPSANSSSSSSNNSNNGKRVGDVRIGSAGKERTRSKESRERRERQETEAAAEEEDGESVEVEVLSEASVRIGAFCPLPPAPPLPPSSS